MPERGVPVSLRALLDPAATGARIGHEFGGYVLRADVTELDALTFEHRILTASGGDVTGPAHARAR